MSEMLSDDFAYSLLKIVGKGGSSTVYKGVIESSRREVAIKQIDTDGLSKDQILGIKGEIDTIKALSHNHIVSYLGTRTEKSKILIFLEYADRGSLRQFYQRRGALKEPQAANCTRQILHGLNYLHANGIAHRDIKCANCLLTKGGVIKLADFGASKRFECESVVSGLKGVCVCVCVYVCVFVCLCLNKYAVFLLFNVFYYLILSSNTHTHRHSPLDGARG